MLSPDLLVELASPSDEGPRGLAALRRTMAAYQANGAQLGWLLIPEQQTVEIWSGDANGEPQQPQRLQWATTLEAGERFPGLSLELTEIWES
ncbi:Uma2 family endonuclease [Cyanobium gracile]|uniref:Uma2 family endonuclease n=1 Tax=Cyanobium gracile UHCC 0281 TaxID=3110309 RepID=A0ABU5SV23_9CYAN|nr:Uma2 family endonuclease [Cyanobium gracile]MEA5442374.1 Uma2 family endonuclease [Cyanobium gracile UHCC 0281]